MKKLSVGSIRKSVRVLLIIPCLILGNPANAANWSGTVKVASIEVSQVNALGVWVSFKSPPYSSHTCSIKSGQYMLGGSVANIDKMTTIATAALVNSRDVSVYWGGGCSGGGMNGYPVLTGITLK